jgi:hypothetical protein
MACVASILDEPLDAFPDLYEEGTRRGDVERWWWGILLEALATRGLTARCVEGIAPAGYAIASIRLAHVPGHAVVTLDGAVVHDPHPSQPSRAKPPQFQHWYVIERLSF